jgi:hypothetical protein
MEPIADVAALRPVLASLKSKGLLISLTSDGRGHVVTHALYEPRELEKLRAEYSGAQPPREPAPAGNERASSERAGAVDGESARPVPPAQPGPAAVSSAATDLAELKRQLEGLRGEVAQLRKDLEDLWANFR